MKTLDHLVRLLAWIAACLFAATGVMLTYEVTARYFFTAPTIWAAELSQMCLIWGSLIAMPWILSVRRHITVTAVTGTLGPGLQKVCELLALLVVFAFSVVVTAYGWEIFHDSFLRGRTTGSLLNLPVWIVELAVPFGFALLALQSIVEFVGVVKHGAPERNAGHE
ncbi:MAG: TRAP transporter small permease [Rhizobiaceae bacterium]|nr:TRAP transporter small permease [Rhizobiaceae bacterium]